MDKTVAGIQVHCFPDQDFALQADPPSHGQNHAGADSGYPQAADLNQRRQNELANRGEKYYRHPRRSKPVTQTALVEVYRESI